MIVSLPGVGFGLLRVDLYETYIKITCYCCGEVFRLNPNQTSLQVLEHEDECPMIELQEAIDAGNAKRVRRIVKAAQKYVQAPKN